MKRLFRHTNTTLLRTALLLGAMILVGTQTKAQTEDPEILQLVEKMPSAFKYFTADEANNIIDDDNYYYIQFYNQNSINWSDLSYNPNVMVFLADCGINNSLQTKDYLPFSNNLQWTFVSSGDGFKLKSKTGNFVGHVTSPNNRYIACDEGSAAVLKFYSRSDGGYEIGLASNDGNGMNRISGNKWANVGNYGGSRTDANNLLRVAELKPNVAHIIYYREEGVDNTSYDAAATRHYLTYSGSEPTGWRSVIDNGNLEGSDANCFRVAIPGNAIQNATITELTGESRGVKVTSPGNEGQVWDSQFFIQANNANLSGKRIHVEFDYRASAIPSEAIPTQAQSTFGGYLYDGILGNITFSTDWQHFVGEADITNNNFQTIAFNLGRKGNITYYFDNIVFTVDGASVIGNGDFEGTTVSNFRTKEGGGAVSEPVLAYGNGCSRGIRIHSNGDEGNPWDTQFFIRANEVIPIGTTIHVEFDYRATNSASGIPTQAHGQPGSYHNQGILGNLDFTTNWQHFRRDVTIDNGMGGGGNDFQSIAFNLGKNGNIDYYFDNIIFNVPITYDVSSRRSIIPSGKSLWSLPTAAAYHQDGLWSLVKASDDGKFYIKKYGAEEYLIPDASGASDLGAKDPTYGEYQLEDPTANRYTRIQNVQYETTALSASQFHWWNGYDAGASQTDATAYVDFQLNTLLGEGGTVAGTSNVEHLIYADLTGNTKMIIEGTPGMQVRVLMNRQESNTGPYTERNLIIGGDGKVELDLTDLPYVHLNAIKIGWGQSGQISTVTLVNQNNILSSSPHYLNYSTGDGAAVYQTSDANDWYAGFYPVEVPVPNKDEFFQVLVGVNNNANMLNHNGGLSGYTEDIENRELWKLEQVDDYLHYRLKDPNTARYLAGENKMTDPNDAVGGWPRDEHPSAEIHTNEKYWTDFSVKWYLTKPIPKEIPVDHSITHKISYLKQYSDQYASLDLNEQGLAGDADSEWWNFDSKTQKVNHFEITHYVKFGQTIQVFLPTILNKQNDHINYQRWYHYNDNTCDNDTYPDGTDIEGLKSHVSLDSRDDGDVQYFLYKNGIVTGDGLDWSASGVADGGMRHYALRTFNYTNSDGDAFTVAADVSRYSEYTYQNATTHLEGDLEEPSLTMRYLYYMKDAKEMATNLSACTYGGDKWLEEKTFHFPAKQVAYDQNKWAGYRGEFIGLRHVFSDYWVFDGTGTGDDNLVSAVNDANGGKIEVVIDDPNSTGIRLGGYNPNINMKGTDEGNDADYQGFYFFDLMKREPVKSYGDSRFIVFRYPSSGEVSITGTDLSSQPAYIKVYLNDRGTRYQLAQFTIIFDKGTETLPWVKINGTGDQVKGTSRDPQQLYEKAGKPIAKITFDYPNEAVYHYPDRGITIHNNGQRIDPNSTIPESGPIPMTFDKTNYSFDGNSDGSPLTWAAYGLVKEMTTTWGNSIGDAKDKKAYPANKIDDYGYGVAGKSELQADAGFQNAYLYIDASEQPGDICSAQFRGDFCTGDKLMFSGWISGANSYHDNAEYRCPGGVTLTVKGEHMVNGKLETETLYRFCPGQCYELNNGTGIDGSEGDGADRVVWQQFYFEFIVGEKYDRHWIEVNNNCVSSNGGDFMLDNIEVYAIVPEVVPVMNTPLCVKKDGTTEMRLLKLAVDHNKLKSSAGVNGDNVLTPLGFVFLKKYEFLKTFRTQLAALSDAHKQTLGLDAFEFGTMSLDDLAYAIEKGQLDISGNNEATQAFDAAYKTAFDAAFLGDQKVWDANSPTVNMGGGVMYFQWNSTFENMELYGFDKAVNKTHPTYRETDSDGVKWVVMNGNYPELPWEVNTDYYIIPSNTHISSFDEVYGVFEICSGCSRASVLRLDPPYTILGMETSDETQEYEVCEGKIPTVLTDLKGYNLDGEVVPLKNINFDWWLGDMSDPLNPVLATLENYHQQGKTINGEDVKLDDALFSLRAYYPDISSLDGIFKNLSKTPELSVNEVLYLQELVEKGQLILHQRSVNIPAQKVSADDPYCYFVACPIHDGYFDRALNNDGANNVAYFCDEPQGLALKIGEKAPLLSTGFVPNENGFSEYNYPDGNPVLSIRLAKKAQFETVKHGAADDPAIEDPSAADADKHFLWLPIRNAEVQSTGSTQVIQKSDDYNVYLASTDDPIWDKTIYTEMSKAASSLPIVGKIVQLNAINTKGDATIDQTANRLCIYFISDFDVREGYSYTLSLPFRESPGENTCDGTILINLKIVPDYEVWTGGADNTDWNNDQNWRRADGNLRASIDEPTAQSPLNSNELYRTDDLPVTSPLKEYVTNTVNYRTPLDRILRKGFAPLYCTHVLIKNNEWGDAPVLYDALDAESGNSGLIASPFPNLRETSTPILKFDMQARLYDIWIETYGSASTKGRAGDLIAEMYQINTCDEIAFQPGAEMRNAHLLNYNNAWVEYELDNNRWYLLGSPLQGTISGEWYAPTGTAQQKTTYYENVTFGTGYDRYSPAIYQRSWDKAKAVLYEVGATYSTGDSDESLDNDGSLPGSEQQGSWGNNPTNQSPEWNDDGADDYLDRLGYKPFGDKKVNVAIKGIWSNTYNDATVDYTNGAFSVMVKNDLKNNDTSGGKAIIRLPKEDTMYDYYKFTETGAVDGGTDTELSAVQGTLNRAKNRGRLKTDLLLPSSTQKTESAASRYGDARTYTRVPTQMNADIGLPIDSKLQSITETVAAGISNLGYYLVENPFQCGLDMEQFFAANTGLEKKYWLLTPAETGQTPRQVLVQQAPNGEWITPEGDNFVAAQAKVAPGQGFFVQATTAGSVTGITFNKGMQAQTRYGAKTGSRTFSVVVGTKQKMTTKTETITLEDNTTKKVTIDVPETDGSGNYVLDDITEDVLVSTYVQSTGDGEVFPLKGRTRGEEVETAPIGLVITAQRGTDQSSTLVMKRSEASNDFLPEEDTEVFINSDLVNVPTVYTLCGRLATTINSIHDFSCLPVGVESNSDAPCTLTFQGVELLGDSVAFYDALEQELIPLESGMTVTVSGQTQNRYFLVRSLIREEAAAETHIQIFTEGLTARVIASTAEPIVSIRCYDTAGRLIHSASPQTVEYSFPLPLSGIYIIDAETEKDRKTKKLMAR